MDELELYHIYRAAMDAEKQSQRWWNEAIKITEGRPELSQLFVELLREEQRHEKRLLYLYKKHKAEFEA